MRVGEWPFSLLVDEGCFWLFTETGRMLGRLGPGLQGKAWMGDSRQLHEMESKSDPQAGPELPPHLYSTGGQQEHQPN